MKEIYKFWWITLFVKLVLCSLVPLADDEAYYWVWSHYLQWSYFDHPPFISWIYWLGHAFEGFESAVRIPGVIIGHLSIAIWIAILKDHIDSKKLRLLFWCLTLAPITGVGSIIIVPDIPLLFFWSLSTLVFKKFIDSKNPGWLLPLGALLGLAFTSKYHAVLFLPLALVAMLWHRCFSKKVFLFMVLGLGLFFIFSFPVWYWNSQNDWISIKFQTNHGLGGQKWEAKWTYMYLIGQFFIIFPTFLYYCKRPLKNRELRWLYVFAVAPVVFFFLTSFKGKVEPNWPSIAYPAIISIGVMAARRLFAIKFTLWFWSAVSIIVVSQAIFQWLPPKYGNKLKTRELVRFNNIIKYIRSHPEMRPLYARSYQMASKLSFETQEPIFKLHTFNRIDFYDFIDQSKPIEKRYFVVTEHPDGLPLWPQQQGHKIIKTFRIDQKYDIKEVIEE